MKRQFSRFIFGTPERDIPVDVELLPDRMVLQWTNFFWKTRKELPWRELSIVPASTVWLGDHPGWDSGGMALRWDTPTGPHRGWQRVWLPCKPDSPFYTEVQRLIASFHPAPPA